MATDQVVPGAGAATVINANFEAGRAAMMYGRRASTTGTPTALTWGFYGGQFAPGVAIADGTITLTNAATNYIVADRTTGVVSSATNTTNWLNTSGYIQLYEVVAAGGVVTGYTDRRATFYAGTGGGGGGQVDSVVAGAGIDVDATDPINPEVALDAASIASLASADSALQPGDTIPAADVSIVDAGGYFTSTDVEGALQELGAGGGGAVASVNGQTGAVVLDAADVGAVASVVAGTNITIDNTDPQNPVINASTASGNLSGFRNRLINGNFEVNARGVSGSVVLAAGAYGHDRWKAGASGCSYTFSTTANITTITISAGSLIQVVEGLNLQSGTHVLSWVGSAQGKIGAGSYSASGVTGSATGGSNLSIEFNTGTLSLAQLEPASTPTNFEFRPLMIETMLCQRYYYENGYDGASGTGPRFTLYGQAGVFSGISFLHPVRMRVAPTITKLGTWAVNNCGQPAGRLGTPVSWYFETQVTTLGGFDVNTNSADDKFTFNAEL